jgi:hypothetical protein
MTVATTGVEPVTSAAVRYGDGTDAALLFREPVNRTTVGIATGTARRGDTVYFANWQNRADGAARKTPALFSGTVLGKADGGYLLAVRNDAGYDLPSDGLLRRGGSGGAVFDTDGRLLGVSVSVDALSATHSAGQLRRNHGVRLPAGWYQVTKAQAVDARLVTSLRAVAQPCR